MFRLQLLFLDHNFPELPDVGLQLYDHMTLRRIKQGHLAAFLPE